MLQSNLVHSHPTNFNTKPTNCKYEEEYHIQYGARSLLLVGLASPTTSLSLTKPNRAHQKNQNALPFLNQRKEREEKKHERRPERDRQEPNWQIYLSCHLAFLQPASPAPPPSPLLPASDRPPRAGGSRSREPSPLRARAGPGTREAG